jgi:hypothetical protein
MPIDTRGGQAIEAIFSIDATRAAELLPAGNVHPFRLWNRGLLMITSINYIHTDIGKYIEFSIGIACTRTDKPAPRLVPLLMRDRYGFGQYVYDLPVSTEVSVKGGKGIWGMPKHQASLDFVTKDDAISSQYDLDGEFAMRIDLEMPRRRVFPITVNAVNYCSFRGMLMKSVVFFDGKSKIGLFGGAKANLTIGDHPLMAPLKNLDINPNPIFTAYYPDFSGVLDDHVESWFLRHPESTDTDPEGMESVINLGQSQEWPEPPDRSNTGA